ncbi:MAG: amidohydrolase family protein [Lentisphaeria bacterium]|nr:amidohydrolase family protein [Lentisphaeria bacterium]
MKDLMFFDANCRIGDYIEAYPGVPELLADMDLYGVDKALVRHNAIPQSPLFSNTLIAGMLKDQDPDQRLTGVWCILPHSCNEIPEPEEFFRQMKENRIGAITLSPFEHRYLPRRIVIGKIMDAAAEHKIPVLLDAFAGMWEQLYDFLETFPRNTFIYTETAGKWGSDRNIRPLLETYENFYFEIARYWVPEGICDLAEKYGADRILYGSNYPVCNQGCSMLQLKHCGLKDGDIAKIAGQNLERILKGAQL